MTSTRTTLTARPTRGARRSAARRCRRLVAVRVPRDVPARLPTRALTSSGPTQRPGRVHLTGRGRLLVLLVVALLMLAAFAVGRSASSQATADEPVAAAAVGQHTVEPGETLWTVARGLAPRRDPRDVVQQIQRINHLRTPALQAGQQLLLPEVR